MAECNHNKANTKEEDTDTANLHQAMMKSLSKNAIKGVVIQYSKVGCFMVKAIYDQSQPQDHRSKLLWNWFYSQNLIICSLIIINIFWKLNYNSFITFWVILLPKKTQTFSWVLGPRILNMEKATFLTATFKKKNEGLIIVCLCMVVRLPIDSRFLPQKWNFAQLKFLRESSIPGEWNPRLPF